MLRQHDPFGKPGAGAPVPPHMKNKPKRDDSFEYFDPWGKGGINNIWLHFVAFKIILTC